MAERQSPPGAPIAAVLNMRDLGGWPTRDEGTVRRGVLYRSAALDGLQGESVDALRAMGIKHIYDLRVAAEREARPDVVPSGVEYTVVDVLKDSADAAPAQLAELIEHPERATGLLGGGQAMELFENGYRQIVTLRSAVEGYGLLFSELTREENRPALFHCTGGKDRTGWAAASILTLLGVADDLVMREYMLTNDQLLPARKPVFDRFEASGGDPRLLLPAFAAFAEFLEASLDEMRLRFGTVEGYFKDGLGLDASAVETLKTTFTDTSR